MSKICSRCKEPKDACEFSKDKRSKDGLRADCKACVRAYREVHRTETAAYRAANRAARAEYNRAYRAAHRAELSAYYAAHRSEITERQRVYNSEHSAEQAKRSRAYYAAHRSEMGEQQRAYYAAHRLEIAEYKRSYNATHRAAARAGAKQHRARKRGNGGRLSAIEWEWIKLRHGYKCAKCGASGELTQDHIVPLSKGGEHSAKNVQPLCRSCNSKKSTKTEDYRSKQVKKLYGL